MPILKYACRLRHPSEIERNLAQKRVVKNRETIKAAMAHLLPGRKLMCERNRHQGQANRAKQAGHQAHTVMIGWIKPLRTYHTK